VACRKWWLSVASSPPSAAFSLPSFRGTVESVFSSRVEFLLASKLLEHLPLHLSPFLNGAGLPPNNYAVSTASRSRTSLASPRPRPRSRRRRPSPSVSVDGSLCWCSAVRIGQVFQSSVVARRACVTPDQTPRASSRRFDPIEWRT
jgi:hypothetical protein